MSFSWLHNQGDLSVTAFTKESQHGMNYKQYTVKWLNFLREELGLNIIPVNIAPRSEYQHQ
jgi:hypothetical protein